jgi:hypothetical protein
MDKTLPEQTYTMTQVSVNVSDKFTHRNNSGWIVYTLLYTECFKNMYNLCNRMPTALIIFVHKT